MVQGLQYIFSHLLEVVRSRPSIAYNTSFYNIQHWGDKTNIYNAIIIILY